MGDMGRHIINEPPSEGKEKSQRVVFKKPHCYLLIYEIWSYNLSITLESLQALFWYSGCYLKLNVNCVEARTARSAIYMHQLMKQEWD